MNGVIQKKEPESIQKKVKDMTEGNIVKLLISFAIPLLLGNLFQQLYNTVDTFVVGNFVSNEAYAAVGNTGPIINTLIGFFSGLATGAGVVISQYNGAKDEKNVRRAVHTTLIMTIGLIILFTVLGIVMAPAMVKLMKTPDEVVNDAVKYLTIYFAGVAGLMIYNVGAGILRAIGDSRRPFYFLVVSALTNVALDLLFVLGFRMGVEGVAYATVISQAISAILVMITLFRSKESYGVALKYFKCDFSILFKIFKVGLPAALQMAVTSFSNVFVQSYINNFGTDFMSGYTSYSKIDQFVLLPMQSVSLASTTFVGQNLGAGYKQRAKKGANISLLMSMTITAVLIIPVMIFAPSLVRFFNKSDAVVEYGSFLLRFISPFYILCCVNQIYSGAVRGAGKSTAPMIIMLSSFVAFRQAYLAVVSALSSSYVLVAFAYPAGWILCSTLMIIYYFFSKWENAELIKRPTVTEHEYDPDDDKLNKKLNADL